MGPHHLHTLTHLPTQLTNQYSHAPLQWTPSPPPSLLPSLRPRLLPLTRRWPPGGPESDPVSVSSPTSLPSTRRWPPGGPESDPVSVSSLKQRLTHLSAERMKGWDWQLMAEGLRNV